MIDFKDKLVFTLGSSFSHYDGSNDNDPLHPLEPWPGRLSRLAECKVINGAIPAASIDTLYKRAKIMLDRWGEPDILIVELTFLSRFLFSDIEFKDTLVWKKYKDKYVYADHNRKYKNKQYFCITPGVLNNDFEPYLSSSELNFCKRFLASGYFDNEIVERELHALDALFPNSEKRYFSWAGCQPNCKNANFIGDCFSWLGIPHGQTNHHLFLDEVGHFTSIGHNLIAKEVMKRC